MAHRLIALLTAAEPSKVTWFLRIKERNAPYITGYRALKTPGLAQHILWDSDQKRASEVIRGLGRQPSP